MEFNAKAVFQNQNLGKHHALRNPQETPPSPAISKSPVGSWPVAIRVADMGT